MVIENSTRRLAIVAAFIPLMALYLIYTFKLHFLLPSIATWPTQQQIAVDVSTFMRHKLFPWTVKVDMLREGLENSAHRTRFTSHIVAVGDLHGDMGNAKKVLQFAGVVDGRGRWTGDVDVLVQTGDIIDRGDDTIPLFAWMDQLRDQAHHVGGVFLSLLGNHEWMNAIGDWRYVYPSELKTFGSIATRQRIVSTGSIGRSWAANYTTAARLPLHPSIGPPNAPYPPEHLAVHFQKESQVLDSAYHASEDDYLSHAALSFVHGGLSPTYSNLAPFPSKINHLGESLLYKLQHRKQPPPHPPNPYPGLPNDATNEEQELYHSNGPLWYRGWAELDEKTVCAHVDEVLEKTGTRRMIMGHTPNFDNIVSRCGGKIIIIDTGISHAYQGVLSALSIHYTLSPIGEDKDKRWLETEIVSAVYPQRREVIVHSEREVVGDFQHSEHEDFL